LSNEASDRALLGTYRRLQSCEKRAAAAGLSPKP
jgi:hypothetical protein